MGEYLFAARNDFADARESLVLEREYAMKAQRKNGFVSDRSIAIIEQRQRDGIVLIWSELLAAHGGEVSSGDAERGPLLDVRRAHSSSSERARAANSAAFGATIAERIDDVLAYFVEADASTEEAGGAEGGDRSGDRSGEGNSDFARGFVGRDEFIEVSTFFDGLVPRHFSSAEPVPAPSFAPQINASSRRLAKRRAKKREVAREAARVAAGAAEGSQRRLSTIDILYEDGQRNSDHKEAKRRELEAHVKRECTFAPKLNVSSRPPPPLRGAAARGDNAVAVDVAAEEEGGVVRALPAGRRNKPLKSTTSSFRRRSFFGYSASKMKQGKAKAKATATAKAKAKVKASQPQLQQQPKRRVGGTVPWSAKLCAVPRTPIPAKRAPERNRKTAHPGAAAAEMILDQLEEATNTLLLSTHSQA